MRQYPLVNLPGLDTLEAEKGEVLVNAQKVTFAVGGKPHSRGGTDMLAEEGSYILSKHLKLDEAVVKALGYAEKRTSPADLSRKSSTQEYKDILDSVNNKRYDDLSKKTAALMFEKNAARQDLIFQAQEDFKASKGMKNNADYAKNGVQVWKDKYQDGGATDPNWGPWSNDMYGGLEALSQAGTYSGPGPLYENPITGKVVNTGVLPQNNPQPLRKNVFGNVPNRINLKAEDTLGYSTIEGNQYASYYRPFANDPYFDVQQDILKTGKMTTTQKKMLGDRQARLSKLKEQFPEPEGSIIEKEYGKYLREADKVEKDIYLDKYVKLADGKEIPLSDATDEQIDTSLGLRFLNKRTGKDDLVDFRDRQNQGFDPTLRYVQDIRQEYDTSNLPIKPSLVTSQNKRPVVVPTGKPAATAQGDVEKGIDWQSIINGTQIGLSAFDLATTRTKPPYYDFQPTELAYTRFEPINTKASERAFNLQREAIQNSNIPEQQKLALLSSNYGQMAEGVNQVDLTNYQNKLANDNRNVDRYYQARNTDIQRQEASNMKYVAESDRRNAQASMQRQAYVDNIMTVWRTHVNNRRDIGLVNQFSRNFDYNLNSQKVEYQAGQGVPLQGNPTNLEGFQQNKGIDPRFLNAEGRKAFGLDPN